MTEPYSYCLVSNIPSTFHSSDLRNFFAVFIEASKFDIFHFRHRPQTVNISTVPKISKNGDQNNSAGGNRCPNNKQETDGATTSTLNMFCCPIRFTDEQLVSEFIKKYHGKYWMDKKGNELPSRVIISKITLCPDDLSKFATKEFRPPKLMPKGNIGTPNAYFLNLIRECRLPPSLIQKLGLEFPRGRVHKKYSNVPFDYGNTVRLRKWNDEEEEEEEVVTGRGQVLSSVYIQKSERVQDNGASESEDKPESDKDSNADDDEDRCEEWERHEALHDHRTTHGSIVDEDKERLYEEKIELKWEKGGSGLVFYTDAQFWNDQKGDFDERTADDWDVDMEGYYVPGGGDKDARDFLEMRRSERFQKGLEDISVFVPKISQKQARPSSPPGPSGCSKKQKIGAFEKYTRGIGRKILEDHGWKDGQGLGSTIVGMSEALESEGQGPMDRRGFGYYGEKIEFSSRNSRNRPRDFKDYRVDTPDRIVIGTIYDKPIELDTQEPLLRRNAPTFMKRYDFVKGSKNS